MRYETLVNHSQKGHPAGGGTNQPKQPRKSLPAGELQPALAQVTCKQGEQKQKETQESAKLAKTPPTRRAHYLAARTMQ